MNSHLPKHSGSAHSSVAMGTVEIDGVTRAATVGEPLVDVLNRIGRIIPQVCYHPQLGPIQTCDTCMVQVNGKLARACGTPVAEGMLVVTKSDLVDVAQREAFDRILGNHMLYCTVCDNNNENCTVHNTTALLDVKHQKRPYKPKPYPVDNSNPFYRYDPDQCILCGRCVEACQNFQVNETLSIDWESENPRVLWDGGETIAGSSCVSCGHCITVCPCNALMEKSMIGHAGYLTGLPTKALDNMIDLVKGIEPETGYGVQGLADRRNGPGIGMETLRFNPPNNWKPLRHGLPGGILSAECASSEWYSRGMLPRTKIVAFAFLLAASLFAQPKEAPTPPLTAKAATPVLAVEGLGQGAIPLDGPWQFQTGDNPEWASPSFDDSRWDSMQLNGSWGSQGHPGYTGYAWYRRHVQIHSLTGSHAKYALLMPPVDDAYEIFWNGQPIGQLGKFPPRPRWYYSTFPTSFPVPSAQSGTIAIRVWKSPLLFVDPDSLGGLYGPPLLGDADTINAQLTAFNAQTMRQNLYDFTLVILYGFVTLLSLLLWSRNRKVKLFLWLAIFTATPVMLFVIQGVLQIPIYYGLGRGFNQPIYALNHVSLWFLLLYLLRLDDRPVLSRWTRVLAIVTVSAGVLDGALAFIWGHAGAGMLALDAILTTLILVVEVFPFVIIGIGIRQRLEPSRWWLAIAAFVSQMINTIADASAAGQRFTHWTLYYKVTTPLFTVFGVHFTAADLAGITLFLSILYAVYRYSMEQQARQSALEQEMQSAREIQRVLIPETLPSLEGFAMSSAYRPAQEVGGDFFQIIHEDEGSTIVALGDVSGKGLKAAMSVSLIVGVLRSLSGEKSSPVEMLEGLNRCLCGRLQGGFVTAIVMRLFPNGRVILANAGHLPPFLNSAELAIEGSLPLGLISFAEYSEMQIQLHPGDHLSLYTDGLVEARSTTGEIYGFERLNRLFRTRPTAQQATEAAIAFGQEDDITVLTLTRLAAGEESTTSMSAPFLEPAPAEA